MFVGCVCASENGSSVKIWFANKSVCAAREDEDGEGDAMFVIASATKLMLLFGYAVRFNFFYFALRLFYIFALRVNGNATAFYGSFICTFPCVCVRPHFIHIFTSHLGMECVCARVFSLLFHCCC